MRQAPYVVRAPWLVLAVATVLTLGALAAAATLRPEVDFVATVPDHPGVAPYQRLLRELDGVRFLAVYMAHDPASGTGSLRGDGFDALVLEQQALTDHLHQRFPGALSHTLSVYEAMRQGNYMLAKIATAGSPPASSYSLPDDPVRYDAVKRQALSDGTLDDVLAQDGSSALLLVFLAEDDPVAARNLAGEVGDAAVAWAEAAERHPVTKDHQPSGLLWSSHVTDETNLREILKWSPIAAVTSLLAMLWVTRRIGNALIAVTGLACAFAWTFGLMALLDIRISFLTFMLAPIVMGIGIDHAIHLLHRYEEERALGHHQAIGIAVAATRRAVIIAALTTAASLAVMGFVSAPLFAEIGLVASLGAVLSYVAAVTVVPALRTVLPTHAPRASSGVGTVLRRLLPSRRTGALVVGIWIAGAGVVALSNHVEVGSAENEFPQDDPLIVLQQRIEKEYGAFQRAYLVVEGDLARAAALRSLHDATVRAADVPLQRDATSITALLLADEATDQGAADIALGTALGATPLAPTDRERLPATDAEAREALDALFRDPLWRTLAPFAITETYDLAVVAIQIDPWDNQERLRELSGALEQHAAALGAALGPGYSVAAAGAPVNRAAVIEKTPVDVLIVTVGAGLAVLFVLAVLWSGDRRILGVAAAVVAAAVVGVLATIPVLDAVYGALADAGAPQNNAALTSMFLLAFAVTVAVAVDDVVHLAHRVRATKDVGVAMQTTGRAILGTSLTTFAAFAPLAGIYFLQSKNLAILSALGVLYAFGATILLARWLAPSPRPARRT